MAVIAGHKKRTVHTPAYCMPGAGWEIASQETVPVVLGDRTVSATRATMTDNKGRTLLTTYFYTDGEFVTNNLVKFQGEQLMKRFRRELPLGALVRIIVMIRTTPQDAAQLSDDLAQKTLPKVLNRITYARETS